jgi:hypothetical protein
MRFVIALVVYLGGCSYYHRIDALPSLGPNVGPTGVGFSMRSSYEVGSFRRRGPTPNFPGLTIGAVFANTIPAEPHPAKLQIGLALRGRYYFVRRTAIGSETCYRTYVDVDTVQRSRDQLSARQAVHGQTGLQVLVREPSARVLRERGAGMGHRSR